MDKKLEGSRNFSGPIPKPSAKDEREAFESWANVNGYDVACTYYTDRSKWIFLNPVTADIWQVWQARAAFSPAAGQDNDKQLASLYQQAFQREQKRADLAEAERDELKNKLADQQAMPEGWKLVPIEPTDEMIDVACESIVGGLFRVDATRVYAAALSAAPKPESEV